MKKIAVITTGLSRIFAGEKGGGGEILLKNLIFELMKMQDVSLSIFAPNENELTQRFIKEYPNIRFFIYDKPSSAKYIDEIKAVLAVEKFDKILNSNMAIPYKTTMLQSHSHWHRINMTPKFFRQIKKGLNKKKLHIQANVFKETQNEADFIAVSNIIKKDYCENFNIPEEKIKVVYPGVHLSNYEVPQKRSTIQFSIVANSSINKGGHYLIFALGILNLLRRDFKLNIIAPKFKYDLLMQFIIAIFNLKKKIKPYSFQNDMTNFYNETDVLVLPSINEAFGLVTLEAMAKGKICLVSARAGSAEIITDNNGFTFNLSSFSDFLKKLDSIINLYNNDFEKFKAISQNARKTSEMYSWKDFAKKVIE